MLRFITQRYGRVSIFVTENGVWDTSATLDDKSRSMYIKDHIAEVLKGQNTHTHTHTHTNGLS